MKVIAWIIDQPDWAYANRARAVAACLPQYEHRVICYAMEGFDRLRGADVVVCPDPRLFPYIGTSRRVIVNLNAVKIFAGVRHGV